MQAAANITDVADVSDEVSCARQAALGCASVLWVRGLSGPFFGVTVGRNNNMSA
ncbi:MAG: hypothetical protein ACJATP_003819 [Candidatus Azotimanducaceae bacterium]|jgi:hypothetical protein